MTDVNDDRGQSEFHDDVGYLNRIDKYLMLANAASSNLNAYAWLQSLAVIFRELSTQMKNEDERAKHSTTLVNLNNEIYRLTSSRRPGLPPELYMRLHQWEMELRRVYDKAGLQNKRKEDRRFGL
jgi:hypothetical protein